MTPDTVSHDAACLADVEATLRRADRRRSRRRALVVALALTAASGFVYVWASIDGPLSCRGSVGRVTDHLNARLHTIVPDAAVVGESTPESWEACYSGPPDVSVTVSWPSSRIERSFTDRGWEATHRGWRSADGRAIATVDRSTITMWPVVDWRYRLLPR